MTKLLGRLWADDCGAILTTEYLTLGSIVALGSAAGLTSIKDAMVDECRDYGQAVRDVSQQHRPQTRAAAQRAAAPGYYVTTASPNQSLVAMTP